MSNGQSVIADKRSVSETGGSSIAQKTLNELNALFADCGGSAAALSTRSLCRKEELRSKALSDFYNSEGVQ